VNQSNVTPSFTAKSVAPHRWVEIVIKIQVNMLAVTLCWYQNVGKRSVFVVLSFGRFLGSACSLNGIPCLPSQPPQDPAPNGTVGAVQSPLSLPASEMEVCNSHRSESRWRSPLPKGGDL